MTGWERGGGSGIGGEASKLVPRKEEPRGIGGSGDGGRWRRGGRGGERLVKEFTFRRAANNCVDTAGHAAVETRN